MAFVVVNLASEYLPDGSFHVFSPNIPGFHVLDKTAASRRQLFETKVLPILNETLRRRVSEAGVGKDIRIYDEPVGVRNFIPEELRRQFGERDHSNMPDQLIAQALESSGPPEVISIDEVEAATAFEAAAKKLLNEVEETIADLQREREQTRALLARLGLSPADNG